MFKVLEYLRTCNIFYLINGPRVWYIWLTYVKKIRVFWVIKQHKNNYKLIYRISKTWIWNRDILGLQKSLLRAPAWPNYFFTEYFHCDIQEQYKIENNVPRFFVSNFRSWVNNFFVFSLPCKKKQSYCIWLIWANSSLLWKSRAHFCAAVMFLDMCKVLKDLDKIY